MNLIVVHYHLHRGGVRSVIANQIAALSAAESGNGWKPNRVVVVHGPGTNDDENRAAIENGQPLEFLQCLGLAYDSSANSDTSEDNGTSEDTGSLEDSDNSSKAEHPDFGTSFVQLLKEHQLLPEQSVIQIHNHHLGKNVSLTGAITALADAGYRLLLQIHDFPEDFRPENYRRLANGYARQMEHQQKSKPLMRWLYPQHKNIQYAVLNQRDLAVLKSVGIPPERIHFLPNPCAAPSPSQITNDQRPKLNDAAVKSKLTGKVPDRPLVLYPVRGIRRKNLGEAILFAAANPEIDVAITLPATSSAEVPSYRRWVDFSESHQLNVSFEAGFRGVDFDSMIRSADALLTTSVAEGFGMVFLECWLHGKPLCGRDLPEITPDFVQAGLDLSNLYSELKVPNSWLDIDAEKNDFTTVYQQAIAQFRNNEPSGNLTTGNSKTDSNSVMDQDLLSEAAIVDELFSGPHLDFAMLSRKTQESMILRVKDDPQQRAAFLALNPLFKFQTVPRLVIEHNRQIVQQSFSLEASGHRLSKALLNCFEPADADQPQDLLPQNQRTSHESDIENSVLSRFLSPNRFYPLRVEVLDHDRPI